jgi:tRNA-2-methylthio-N6-dimethylallyladenosine synthase
MKRAYTRKKYMEKLDMVRAAIPEVAVTTDIIVGFPGETEEDFAETLSLVEEARYDAAYTFQYSPRPMTEAADYEGHLPKEIVQARYDRLTALQDRLSFENNIANVGRVHEVLVEGSSKKDPLKLTGRSRTNKLIHFDSDGAPEGSIRTVRVTDAHTHHLEGEIAPGRTRAPSHSSSRMTLPLASQVAGCGSCS